MLMKILSVVVYIQIAIILFIPLNSTYTSGQSSADYEIEKDVFNSAGIIDFSASDYNFNGTIGQSITIGNQLSVDYTNQSGFWCSVMNLSVSPALGLTSFFVWIIFCWIFYQKKKVKFILK